MAKAPPWRLITRFLLLSALLLLLFFQLIAPFWVHHLHNADGAGCAIASNSQPAFSRPLTTTNAIDNNNYNNEHCQQEYDRLTINRLPISPRDLRRSRAHWGNTARLETLVTKLSQQQQPTTSVVFGGSITVGHGSRKRYSDLLEDWMNEQYPIVGGGSEEHQVLNRGSHVADNGNDKHQVFGSHGADNGNGDIKHQVLNRGSHGADMCAMAKRLNLVLQPLSTQSAPDLIILEFAVNDYQGQDQLFRLDWKTDAFFEGFQDLAVCAEVVIHKLLTTFPKAAILFLEFQTLILPRKTAAILHLGVAKQYGIPVLSYADVIMPSMEYVLNELKDYRYTAPILNSTTTSNTAIEASPIRPYPFGCAPCQSHNLIDQFAKTGCKPLCKLLKLGKQIGAKACEMDPPAGRVPCYLALFDHDEVHPSAVGHQLATDLIVEVLATTARDTCQEKKSSIATTIATPNDLLPQYGWMLERPGSLAKQFDFDMVNDTMKIFVVNNPLKPSYHSNGFSLYSEQFDRQGWIATKEAGGETVQFLVDLPHYKCYAIYLSTLRSYRSMGTFTVTVEDLNTHQSTPSIQVDGQWEAHISIPADTQLTFDDKAACTGKCLVTVLTDPQVQGRDGNKVKIMTLAVRKCVG